MRALQTMTDLQIGSVNGDMANGSISENSGTREGNENRKLSASEKRKLRAKAKRIAERAQR